MLAREWSDHSCLKEFRLADAKTVLSATIKYAAPATAIGKTKKERGKIISVKKKTRCYNNNDNDDDADDENSIADHTKLYS